MSDRYETLAVGQPVGAMLQRIRRGLTHAAQNRGRTEQPDRVWISAIPVSNAALFPPKISWFAVLDRMREAGLSFDEIEAVVAALEREQEGQR